MKKKPPPKNKFVLPPRKKENKFSVLWNGEWHVVIGKKLDNGNVEFQVDGRTFHSGTHKAL